MNKLVEITTTKEFLAFTEEDARAHVEEAYKANNVEDAAIKYKKPTRTKVEHWIVTVKIRHDEVGELVIDE